EGVGEGGQGRVLGVEAGTTDWRPAVHRAPSPGSLVALPIGLFRSNRHHRLELQEALLADALHVHQLLDLLEGTVLLAVIDDELRGLGADPWQRFQLRRRPRVYVDRRRDRGRTLRFRPPPPL